MDLLLVLLAAAIFPVACLGFVLWMARLEDSIPEAVRRATHTPDPPPVLAIPVRRPTPAAVAIPVQRSEPPAAVELAAAAPAAAATAAPAGLPTPSEPTGT
jgi:hypothetical protein